MNARVFFIMTFLLASVNAKASSAKPTPQNEQEPATKKTEDVKQKPSQPPAPVVAAQAAPGGALVPAHSDQYVHQWLEFPAIHGLNIRSREKMEIKAKYGRVTVLVFLASWCVPCQGQMRHLLQMEEKYRDRYTDFVYIFAHDTIADALGFSAAYKLGNNAIMASASILNSFHQPELPSYYVADRYKWLIMRSINTQDEDLKKLDDFLDLHTAM